MAIQFEPPKLVDRVVPFQSVGQAIHYAAFTIPALVLLWLLAAALQMDDPKWPLIGALLGSAIHLALMLPAKLSVMGASSLRAAPEARAWIEKEGYVETKSGLYTHPSTLLAYKENKFTINQKESTLIIIGPEYQIRRLRKHLKEFI